MRPTITPSLIEAALGRVPAHELPLLLAFVAGLESVAQGGAAGDTYLTILRSDDASLALKAAAGLVHYRWRETRLRGGAVQGLPATLELADCRRQIEGLTQDGTSVHSGTRPQRAPLADAAVMPGLSDGRFIQLAHEVMLGRGCQAHELMRWQTRLSQRGVTREGVLAELLKEAVRVAEQDAARLNEPSTSFHVMGTGERVTLADWHARVGAIRSTGAAEMESANYPQRFQIKSAPLVLVSAITSLYKGGAHIERFMDNIVGQTCFREHAELIIVDADSPDGEHSVIERYLRRLPNIKYLRINHRIGIYDAWNVAVKAAAGAYLTCTNVDDIRRRDSLEQQAAVLENLPFVDVVYQDFYYSLDATLSFEQVAAVGYRSDLPLVTPHGLMQCNPPHNAPMWRRRLHDELGLFDPRFESAGDYDFWMRCVIAGKTFFKMNEAHVAYFQNPRGLSTRPDTRGHEETRAVHKRYGRQLVSDNLVMPMDAFVAHGRLGSTQPGNCASDGRQPLVHRALLAVAAAAKRTARP